MPICVITMAIFVITMPIRVITMRRSWRSRCADPRDHDRALPAVITTNLAFKQWGTVFHDASCLGALVDRFAQHCHVLDIDADSWRNKESLKRNKPRKSKAED